MRCPNCKIELAWGYPTPEAAKEQAEKMKRGEFIWCGCMVEEKNYCPRCGALVWEYKPPEKRSEE